MISYYFLIVGLVLIFNVYYMGMHYSDRQKTYDTIRKRLKAYGGGRYAWQVEYMPGQVMYRTMRWTIFLTALFWPVELGFYLYITFKNIFGIL